MILVTGAGGFIGHHLVKRLRAEGNIVRGVDLHYPVYEPSSANEFLVQDLRDYNQCYDLFRGVSDVFHLAADMGGIGYITSSLAEVAANNIRIDTNVLEAATRWKVERFFYASSACVYPRGIQEAWGAVPLSESMAWPADPEPGYGLEKLFAEELCQYYAKDFGLKVRIARFHNVYGPCFDEQTEVLTLDGWKLFSSLRYADNIATMNPVTGTLEYQAPVAIQTYSYVGPMYRVKSRNIDLFVTPDHSLYYAYQTSGSSRRSRFRLGKAKAVRWSRARMYFSCGVAWSGSNSPSEWFQLPSVAMKDGRAMSVHGTSRLVPVDSWLAFVGWYLSEGSSWITPTNYTVSISQSPGPNQDHIVSLLSDMGFSAYVAGRNVNVSSKQLYVAVQDFGCGANSKRIPRWYLLLPPSKLKVLFEALMAGDGDADGGRYSSTSNGLADAVQEMALKLGYGAWISKEESTKPQHSAIYRVHIRPTTRIDTKRRHRTIEEYSGQVYDVTVPNHIILVRRNGKPVWSGNCGTYDGGREKAPAAICRKTALASPGGEVRLWGDGTQTRSFLYVDDCVDGVLRLMRSDIDRPINIGSEESIPIRMLASMIGEISGKSVAHMWDTDKPRGVKTRNSDSLLARCALGWEPKVSLMAGLTTTYWWVVEQLKKEGRYAFAS